MNHTDNKKQQQASNDDDKAIDKLEEMWDRQILKGDEEFYESRIQSKAGKENSENIEKRLSRGYNTYTFPLLKHDVGDCSTEYINNDIKPFLEERKI